MHRVRRRTSWGLLALAMACAGGEEAGDAMDPRGFGTGGIDFPPPPPTSMSMSGSEGGFTASSFDDGGFTASSFDDGSLEGASFDDGSLDDGSLDDGSLDDGGDDTGGGGPPQCDAGEPGAQTTVAGPRPGLAFRWEGGLRHEVHPRAHRIADGSGVPDVLAVNPTNGAVSVRLVLAEWRDRLPGRIALAIESQDGRRVRLDWDRTLVATETTVTVDDRDLRPVVFTRAGTQLVAPPGVHASLVDTGTGWELVHFDDPDRIERFAAVGGGATKLVEVRDGYGNAIAVTHDADGRIGAITPARAPAVTVVHDGDRIVSVGTAFATATLQWSGDELVAVAPATEEGTFTLAWEDELAPGQLSRLVTPTGRTVDVSYNADATVHCVGVPGNHHVYEYVSASEVQATDRFGQVTHHRHANGAVVELAQPFGTTTYEWADLDLVRLVDGTGRVHEQSWDARGHATSWTDENGTVTTYGWDGDRLASSVRDGVTTTYERNAQGRVTRIAMTGGGSQRITDYTWSDVGLVESKSEFGSLHAYAYDEQDRVVSLAQNGATLFTITYDAAGRVVTATDGADESFAFGYTGTHRLPSTIGTPGGSQAALSSGSEVWIESSEVLRAGTTGPNAWTMTLTADGRPAELRLNGALVQGFSY